MARFNKNTLKAILPTEGRTNGRRLDNKELIAGYSLVSFANGEFRDLVSAFAWTGRSRSASTIYAAIWIHGDDSKGIPYTTGSGQAGGYGYHKLSSAIGSAITSAGIELRGAAYSSSEPDFDKRTSIDGVGDTAIEAALYAIGEAAGYALESLHLVRVA